MQGLFCSENKDTKEIGHWEETGGREKATVGHWNQEIPSPNYQSPVEGRVTEKKKKKNQNHKQVKKAENAKFSATRNSFILDHLQHIFTVKSCPRKEVRLIQQLRDSLSFPFPIQLTLERHQNPLNCSITLYSKNISF